MTLGMVSSFRCFHESIICKKRIIFIEACVRVHVRACLMILIISGPFSIIRSPYRQAHVHLCVLCTIIYIFIGINSKLIRSILACAVDWQVRIDVETKCVRWKCGCIPLKIDQLLSFWSHSALSLAVSFIDSSMVRTFSQCHAMKLKQLSHLVFGLRKTFNWSYVRHRNSSQIVVNWRWWCRMSTTIRMETNEIVVSISLCSQRLSCASIQHSVLSMTKQKNSINTNIYFVCAIS